MAIELPPNGTHGARIPSGSLLRFGTTVVSAMYRLTGGRTGHTLLLSTVGAKSGRERIASIRRFDEPDGQWLVVASAGGAARHPAWAINLARHPDQVSAEVGSDRFQVTPVLLTGEERATAWRRIVAEAPSFGSYEQKTDREIPVVRLTRVG